MKREASKEGEDKTNGDKTYRKDKNRILKGLITNTHFLKRTIGNGPVKTVANVVAKCVRLYV